MNVGDVVAADQIPQGAVVRRVADTAEGVAQFVIVRLPERAWSRGDLVESAADAETLPDGAILIPPTRDQMPYVYQKWGARLARSSVPASDVPLDGLVYPKRLFAMPEVPA